MQGYGVTPEMLDAARLQALLQSTQQGGSGGGRGGLQFANLSQPAPHPPAAQPGFPQPAGAGGLSLSDLQLLQQLQAAGLAGGMGQAAGLFGGQQFGAGSLGDHAATGAMTAQGNAGSGRLPIGLEELSKLGRGGVGGGHIGGGSGGGGGKPTRSSDSRSSSAYASRHQAAEQRRRTRINERLELLRKMVPHAERANTACFLEEVIKYIDTLQRRTMELEAALGIKSTTKAPSSNTEPEQPVTLSNTSVSCPPLGASALSQFAALQHAAAQQQQQQQQVQQQVSLALQQQQQQQHTQQAAVLASAVAQQSQQQQAGLNAGSLQPPQQQQQGQQGQGAGNGGTGAIGSLSLPNDLQGVQVPAGLQLSQGLYQPNTTSNNKSFLQFNEDMYLVKPESLGRIAGLPNMPSSNGATVGTGNGNGSLQLPTGLSAEQLLLAAAASSAQAVPPLPVPAALGADARKALSSSPVSSEESGVPIKKRKVLLL